MHIRQIKRLGIAGGDMARLALSLIGPAIHAGMSKSEVARKLLDLAKEPARFLEDPHFAALAKAMARRAAHAAGTPPPPGAEDPADDPAQAARRRPRAQPVPWKQWGSDLDAQAVEQMNNACSLPVAVVGALMPDAHVGYGLPIGGVLATDHAVVPYAVGVDIACRMKLTVLDLPLDTLVRRQDWLTRAIEEETRFGVGSEFKRRREHPVLDADWNVSPVTRRMFDRAHAQLGTSGSGNHFVEFGQFTVDESPARDLGLPGAGTYLALLSHSGSRGSGAEVCRHYSHLAMKRHEDLPKHLRYLAWLDMDRDEGREYWAAMQLMGQYAAANHALIHHHIARHLGARVLLDVENHHNFAWEEEHQGRRLIVHRKGATPAGPGVLGIIPGSMAAPGFLVRGKGSPDALHSASHGAGRVMSRTQAHQTYRWKPVLDYLKHRQVTVISAGLDEVPFVYKDIHQVIAAQADLVEVLGRFDPRLVKMAPAGERPED